jgi:WD40 repeat protein
MAFLPSGKHLITGCEDHCSRAFEVATGAMLGSPLRHQGNVTNLALSADGRRLISACSGVAPFAGARVQNLPAWSTAVSNFGPDIRLRKAVSFGKRLFARQDDGTVLELAQADGRQLRTVWKADKDTASQLAPPRSMVLFHYPTKKAQVIDLPTGRTIHGPTQVHHYPEVGGYQVAGRLLHYDYQQQKLRLLPLTPGGLPEAALDMPGRPVFCAHDGPNPFGGPILAAFISPKRPRTLSMASHNRTKARILDMRLNVLAEWEFSFGVGSATISPRGDILAVMSHLRTQFIDLKKRKLFGPALTRELPEMRMCFHPSEPVVVIAMPDGTIFPWHVPTSKAIGPVVRFPGLPTDLVALSDGSGYLRLDHTHRPIQWPHLKPKAGSVAELKRWVEELTGTAMDDNGELVPLAHAK